MAAPRKPKVSGKIAAKARQALVYAEERARQAADWVDLHNALFGLGGKATALFPTDLDPNGLGISGRNQYVVSASGERFLMNQSRPGGASPPVTVLLNWTAALKR